MSSTPWLRLAGVLLFSCILPTGAFAGELSPPGPPAPTMKRLDQIDPSVCIESLPHTITAPGRYTLCGSLTAVAGQPGIVVLASDVVIDGGGFVLQGVPGSFDGVLVEGERDNVVIQNVVVRGFGGHGIHAPESSVRCVSTQCLDNGGSGFVISAAVLEACVGSDNGGDGFDAPVAQRHRGHVTILKRCDFSNNGGTGVRLTGGRGGDCDDTRAFSNGAEGFLVTGAEGHVTILKRCDSSSNGSTGLHVTGSERVVCEDSTFRDADGDGFGVSIVGKKGHVTILKRCDVSSNSGGGLSITGADRFACDDSSFLGNDGDGLSIEALDGHVTILKACDSSGNTGSGLHMTGGSLIADSCDFSSNGGTGMGFVVNSHAMPGVASSSVVCSSSRLHGNASHGLHVSTSVDGSSSSVALSSSSFVSNGQNGCLVESSHSSGRSSLNFTKIEFRSNGSSGLHVVSGPDDDCDGVLEACVSNNNGVHGFFIDSSSSSRTGGWNLKENKGAFNEEDGLRFAGGGGAGKVSVQDFHFTFNKGHGAHFIAGDGDGTDGLPPSSLDIFTHNGRLLDNAGDGLHVASPPGSGEASLTGSGLHCSRNAGNGAFFSCPVSIEDSSFTKNSLDGKKHTKTGHVTLLKRVISTGNGGSGLDVDCDETGDTLVGLRVIECVYSDNGGHGIHVQGRSGTSSVSVCLEGVSTNANTLDGVHVTGGPSNAACNVSLTRCDSSRNQHAGVHISSTTGGQGLPPGSLSVVASSGRCEDNGADGMFVSRSSSFGSGSGKVSIQDFHFTRNGQNGLLYDCSADIDSCSFSKNVGNGVKGVGRKEFKGHVTLLKRVISSGNGGNGFDFDTEAADAVFDLHVESSVCSNNGENGIHLSVREPTVVLALACTSVSSNSNDLHGMLIVPVAMDKGLRFSADRSSFSRNGETGITVNEEGLESCVLTGSEASSNGAGGVVVVCDVVHLEGNTVSSNTGDGISLSSSHGGVVRDNSCGSNTGRGITISTSHVEYASNRCVSNGISGIEVAGGFANVLRDNFVSGNADFGIVLHTSENRVYENRAGVQVNPLFESDPGLFNDKSQPATATVRGDPNIGF